MLVYQRVPFHLYAYSIGSIVMLDGNMNTTILPMMQSKLDDFRAASMIGHELKFDMISGSLTLDFLLVGWHCAVENPQPSSRAPSFDPTDCNALRMMSVSGPNLLHNGTHLSTEFELQLACLGWQVLGCAVGLIDG